MTNLHRDSPVPGPVSPSEAEKSELSGSAQPTAGTKVLQWVFNLVQNAA